MVGSRRSTGVEVPYTRVYKVGMRVDDAVSHFGSAKALAQELGLKGPAAVSNWRARNRGIVPELYARRLHEKTRGKLRFDRETYQEH